MIRDDIFYNLESNKSVEDVCTDIMKEMLLHMERVESHAEQMNYEISIVNRLLERHQKLKVGS